MSWIVCHVFVFIAGYYLPRVMSSIGLDHMTRIQISSRDIEALFVSAYSAQNLSNGIMV